MGTLEFLNETKHYAFFRDFFQGTEVIFVQDKKNPEELMISAESTAKVLGYESADKMLGNDKVLDKLNEYMKRTGKPFPVREIKDY